MNQLLTYRDARGLTDEQLASEISALIGKKVSPQAIRLWGSRKSPPKAWAAALGLQEEAPPEPAGETVGLDDDGDSGETPVRDVGSPPKAPPGARAVPTTAGDYSFVRDRIAKFYGAVGAGASMLTQNDGYGKVADTYSKDLADAWVAAAKANVHVAKIVSFLESGGPVGELVVAHIILALGFVYVSGRGPDLDFLYAAKFGSYRAAAAARLEAEGDFDGAAQNGQADSMAYGTPTPGA